MHAEELRGDYESISTNLLDWIEQKIRELRDRRFPNSLKGIQEGMIEFNKYRTIDKPPKFAIYVLSSKKV